MNARRTYRSWCCMREGCNYHEARGFNMASPPSCPSHGQPLVAHILEISLGKPPPPGGTPVTISPGPPGTAGPSRVPMSPPPLPPADAPQPITA